MQLKNIIAILIWVPFIGLFVGPVWYYQHYQNKESLSWLMLITFVHGLFQGICLNILNSLI